LLANVFTERKKDFFSMDIPEGFEDISMIVPIEDIASHKFHSSFQ
jgi:hypothetical protein